MAGSLHIDTGLMAVAAFGVLLIANHQLCENLSLREMVEASSKIPRTFKHRVAWFVGWVVGPFLAFWMGIWGVTLLSALCVSAIMSSELVEPLQSAGWLGSFILMALNVALAFLIAVEHLRKVQSLAIELGLHVRKSDTPVYYLIVVTLLFLKVSSLRILLLIVTSLLLTLYYSVRLSK